MNLLFERLKLQANLRRLTETYGQDTALELYRTALQRELNRIDREQLEKDHSQPS